MGLVINVYRWAGPDCSMRGISAQHDKLCVVNCVGPFEPSEDCPAVELVKLRHGNVVLQPVDPEYHGGGGKWLMFGGNFGYTSDSRFNAKVRELSGYDFSFPVAIHDRYEG
jgi:hypothetical protein